MARYAMPVVAQRMHARLPVDASHVPERFALFTIIVLPCAPAAVTAGSATALLVLVVVELRRGAAAEAARA